MVIDRWRQIESLFLAAREKSVEERARFLEETCASDPALRREVETLLVSEDLASGFLESDGSGAPSCGAGEPVPPGERVGPYTVIELLGAGGMGRVYKARDERLDRYVAIKFLPPVATDDAAARERFEREARAASALNHPNICTVHDVGEFLGRAYIVMELLEGQSLKERIAQGPVSLPEFAAVSRQVCDGLEAAHARGIVHRDVKPANLFVTHGGPVKILDFGLAKRGAESPRASVPAYPQGGGSGTSSLTAGGSVVGTLAYMSPEQAVGEEVDARSDIFSLGVVLYEMATGRPPFHGKTVAGVLGSILTEWPEKPSVLNSAFPAALDRVVLKALEKDRETRYPSVAELSADLDEWRQAAVPVRTRRWIFAAAGAGAAGLAGAGFLARRMLFPPERRILVAVMPFANAGGDPGEAFFASGLHQEMISVLNRLYPDRLGAIARTSVQRYRAAGVSMERLGRELNVGYVVEGAVRREGGQARITARLIRVRDQAQLWGATYSRDLGRILSAQTEIANAIAREIERGLRPDAEVSAALAKPLIPAAHEAYLRGEYAKAVEIDPGYAAAYTGMANSMYYAGLFGFQPPRAVFTNMMNTAAKAVQLDPTQAGAYASLALGKLHLAWNWSGAEKDFQRALQLDPSDGETRHFFGHFLLWGGRREEAVRESRRGLEVDPYNPDLISCIGWHELCAEHEDKALQETRRALSFDPNHGWALLTLGWIYEQQGKYQEALAAFRKSWDTGLRAASIGHAFARAGNRRAAENILGDLLEKSKSKYVSPYDIATTYAGLDDNERVFEYLNRACDEHSGFLLFVSSDPRFRPLRRDARFEELLRRIRVPNRLG